MMQMSNITGIILILMPQFFDGCVVVCDQQDEFLMETQTRLLSEITQRCLGNARRSGLAAGTFETLPIDADGPADSMTTA